MKFKFIVHDNVVFQCNLECQRCIGLNKSGQRCKRKVCIGLPYCFTHLTQCLHLKIKQSNLVNNAGKGLFAWDTNKNQDEVVFKRGNLICEYGGEFITREELDERYGEKTAPYGIEINRNLCQDGACKRGIGVIANTANTKRENNAEFYLSTRPQRMIKLRATRPIKNHEEILVDYGNEYDLHEDGVFHKTVSK
jgi:hypothetical protein